MSNKEILEKAMRKAIDRGWDNDEQRMSYRFKLPKGDYSAWDYFDEQDRCWYREGKYDEPDERLHYKELIFNHEFCKALWGTKLLEDCDEPWELRSKQELWVGGMEYFNFKGEMWQFHLQQMVIAPDPIKYLGDNL